jgi:hypothetical protein
LTIEPQDVLETAQKAAQAAKNSARINAAVAVTVAILATFMGICKVKDDNIVQAMQQAQADKLDHWNFYQARHIRQDMAEATVVQLRLASADRSGPQAAAYAEALEHYSKVAQEQRQKRDELKAQAEQDQKNYDALNFRDDQFDLSDALLAIAIALLAVTALTQLWWLYLLAWLPISGGVWMGLAGLLGWSFHPDALVKLLS